MVRAPKRILFPYTGDTIGGSHVSSLILAQNLPVDRFDPVIGVHRMDGPLVVHLTALGIDPLPLPDLPMPSMGSLRRQVPVFWKATAPLKRLLTAHQIDIVHTNDIRMHQLWGLPTRLAGAAHLWHQRTPTRAKRLDTYARLAPKVVTISEYCRAELPPRLQSAAQVVANPFVVTDAPDRNACRAALLSELGCSPETRVIGFVSNFADRKRPDLMVEIAERLRTNGVTDFVIPMFGAPHEPGATDLAAAITHGGLQSEVRIMGPRFPIEPVLAAMDILIAPARREAFGRTLVEAMLCGTPVVASNEGGHREIVEHEATGLLATPDDPSAFASAITSMLANPDQAARIARAARAHVAEAYSARKHAEAIAEIYAEC